MDPNTSNEFMLLGMLVLGFALGFVAHMVVSKGQPGKLGAVKTAPAAQGQGSANFASGKGVSEPLAGYGLATFETVMRQELDRQILASAQQAAVAMARNSLGVSPPATPAPPKV